jgi:dihydrodipicolinate synthase/N-acetylneuraminate lyase
VKAALALQGLISEELRLPMTPVSSTCRERLRGLLQGAGAL